MVPTLDRLRLQHIMNCDRMARAAVEYRMRAAFGSHYDGR